MNLRSTAGSPSSIVKMTVLTTGLVASLVLVTPEGRTADGPPDQVGSFSPPFTEPTINGITTEQKCIDHYADGHTHSPGDAPHSANHEKDCKPAAASLAILPTGKILYWNGLEGTENIKSSVGVEIGEVSANDQTRLLNLGGGSPTWSRPTPVDGGANPNGYAIEPLVPGSGSTETYNDGALFCSDLTMLADGRVLAAGGTAYYQDPQGVFSELEGLRNTRIYNPRTNRWSQTGDMKHGRWYPTTVTLSNGKVFVASGVQKLIKPLYLSHPADSGRNVVQTETFDAGAGRWTYNGASADRSLPLFPRLHLLPNGHVYYNAAGQAFNPAGQSYDEAIWHLAASYNPSTKTWSDLGVPGVGTAHPGFRGSSFSVMLPLVPDSSGLYTKARFLAAGGVFGTTPGSGVPVDTSAVTTVDTAAGNAISTLTTGPMNQNRWYSTGVALPTGEVLAFSGADFDEVVAPGMGKARNTAELFNPITNSWRQVATSQQVRSYHNTAALLPDGRVLVAGHAPIPTLYGNHQTIPGNTPNDGRDPSFEIYSPPYLFWGARPRILGATVAGDDGGDDDDGQSPATGSIRTDIPASQIETVVLVRNTTITHLVDADQRSVVLRILSRNGHRLKVAKPGPNAAPPGPYLLFVTRRDAHGRGQIPSVGEQIFIN